MSDAAGRRLGLAAALDGTAAGDAAASAAVRRTALVSLPASEAVEAALDDPAPLVRREAAEQAARRPTFAAGHIDRLSAMLLKDEDTLCREAAGFALGETGSPGAARALEIAVKSEREPVVREAVAASLGAIGATTSLPVLVAMTEGEKPSVRRRAVVALAAYDDPAADAAIERALDDRDRYVREAAEWLLR